MELYTTGGIDLASAKEKIDTYNLESTTLREEIERIKDSLSEEVSDEEIIALAESLEKNVEDPEKARIAAKILINKVVFDGNEITIYWLF